jgi:hypothetical protein
MSTTTVQAIKTAIATKLGTISGLRTFDYQPDQVNPPFAFPSLQSITYHYAMAGGRSEYQFIITVVAGRQTDRYPERALDQYLDFTNGVRGAIMADQTLGGVVQACIVTSAGNVQTIDAGDAVYLSIDFNLTIYA